MVSFDKKAGFLQLFSLFRLFSQKKVKFNHVTPNTITENCLTTRYRERDMSAGVNGANRMMADLMRILLQGMQEQTDMAQQLVAVGVENQVAYDKMALAQNIIDVYA